MGKISLCLGIYGDTAVAASAIPASALYKSAYKQLISALYAKPDFPFSFFLPGTTLEWLQKNHEEYIVLIGELIGRKQVEVLGGGYYNPLMPLLLPIDRTGQIELLTTAQRKCFGKRPRGCWLNGSAWEPSLINSLTSCGMEYVLLDYSLFAAEGEAKSYAPAIADDLGKSVLVLPLHSGLFDLLLPPAEFLRAIQNKVPKSMEDAAVTCFFSATEVAALLERGWFDDLLKCLGVGGGGGTGAKGVGGASSAGGSGGGAFAEKFELSLPSKIVKGCACPNKLNIPSGMCKKDSAWTHKAYAAVSAPKSAPRRTVQDFPLLYPEILNLHSRMLYTSLLISQCHGDKTRKKAAREDLWKAQNGEAYRYLGSGGIANEKLRARMYQAMLSAEKLAREAGPFAESLSALDFNSDGTKEYIAQFGLYDAYVSRFGGAIFELDVLPCERNFANTICEGVQRKLFTDYLLGEKDFDALAKGGSLAAVPPLAGDLYAEAKFDRVKKSVKLEAFSKFGKQTVHVVKEYHFTKDSIRVDYRLINTSKEPVVAWFVVENSLCMAENGKDSLIADCSGAKRLLEIPTASAFYRAKDIFYLRLNDVLSGCCFTVSSSDPAGVYSYPLFAGQEYSATAAGLFWKVSILPGAVLSRTVTLYIKAASPSKRKKAVRK